jgi:hypothetical protein
MNKGKNYLVLEIVPDSGMEPLRGLTGRMSTNFQDGEHFYEFDYMIDQE